MTKNEAIEIANTLYSENMAKNYIEMLEKLKLIKFDEEKKVPSPESIIALNIGYMTTFPHNEAAKIIYSLAQYGYIIARKGD